MPLRANREAKWMDTGMSVYKNLHCNMRNNFLFLWWLFIFLGSWTSMLLCFCIYHFFTHHLGEMESTQQEFVKSEGPKFMNSVMVLCTHIMLI